MSKKLPFIYLASQSPRRTEILKSCRLRHQVVPSAYQERAVRTTDPAKLVLRHALGKARLAKLPKKKRSGSVILGADTIVYCRGKILGKPKTLKEAARMLAFLSGKPHQVYTGICLLSSDYKLIYKGWVKSLVYFNRLTDEAIANYLKNEETLDKAGAYAIQNHRGIVRKISGSYSNIMGLPSERLLEVLA